METIVILTKLNACEDALEWAEAHPDPSEAWNSCDRIDWMFWLLSQNGANLDAIVELACDNTIHALAALPEPQSETNHICEDLIAVVRRFIKGTATKTELIDARSARSARSDAWSAAWYAWSAAESVVVSAESAWFARSSECAWYARSAAESSARSARSARSAVRSAAESSAKSSESAWFAKSAKSAEKQWQCDHVRERFSAVDVMGMFGKKE